MTDVYIQMVLDESLYKRRLAMLTDQINKALDEKDKDAFLTLSKEYARSSRANKPILKDWLLLPIYNCSAINVNRLSCDICGIVTRKV